VTHWFDPSGKRPAHRRRHRRRHPARDTIKLEGVADETMDTDIVAMGPMLVDVGAGYSAALGGGLAFIAQFNAIVGVPVVGELGSSKLNFGVHIDANLGVVIGF
jgi:hypothetical protein